MIQTRKQQLEAALRMLAAAEPLLRGHHLHAWDNVTQAISMLENELLLYQFKSEATP